MWIQKSVNKWLIKRAIWSKYVDEIEAEEAEQKAAWLLKMQKIATVTEFFKDWVNEMKKEVKKNLWK